MTTVSPSRQLAIGRAYDALPLFSNDALPAWHAMAEETMRQLDLLLRLGVDVMVDDADPYATAAEMMDDVRLNRRIRVLGTHATGSHPVWSDDVNDAFRAVHDVFGHYGARRGFDRHGEEAAFRIHSRMYSPLARLAMTTETRGQNASMITSGGRFPVQRISILPAWARSLDALQPLRSEAAAAYAQARAFHAAAGLAWPMDAATPPPILTSAA